MQVLPSDCTWDKLEEDKSKLGVETQEYLTESVGVALELLQLQKYIGRTEPDVKT